MIIVKQHTSQLFILGEDSDPDTELPVTTYENISEMNFRVERIRMFNKIKEIRECQ